SLHPVAGSGPHGVSPRPGPRLGVRHTIKPDGRPGRWGPEMGWCRWRGWAAWLAAAGDPLSALAQGPPGGARSVDLGRARYDPRTVAQAAPLAPAAPVD